MSEQLVIAAIGEDRAGLVDTLSGWILECGGNIADSRMMAIGGQFAILLLVSGESDCLTKLESQQDQTQKRIGMALHLKRTHSTEVAKKLLAFGVKVESLDHPGIVHGIANFFSKRQINIHDLSTSTYSAAHSGAPMFCVRMTLDLPSDAPTQTLRQEFLAYCDQLNLDASMEPLSKEH